MASEYINSSTFRDSPLLFVPTIEDDEKLNNVEKLLRPFFRCCFFRERCYFMTDFLDNFFDHLIKCHTSKPLFCTYCYDEEKDEEFFEPSHLIDHLLYEHGYRRYQCNLCTYRAPSKVHVHLHQANFHGKNFSSTIKGQIFVDICKVIKCNAVVYGPQQDSTVSWINNRHKRIAKIDAYQCLYCDISAPVMHVVLSHVATSHCDYDLCIYDKYHDVVKNIDALSLKEEPIAPLDEDDEELDDIVNQTLQDSVAYSPGPIDEPIPSPENDTNISQISGLMKNGQANEPLKDLGSTGRKFITHRVAKKRTGRTFPNSTIITKVTSETSESDSETDTSIPTFRRPRGYIPEKNPIHPPLPPSKRGGMFRCLICNNGEAIRQVGIDSHVKQVHSTPSTMKCSGCPYIGPSIKSHIKQSDHKDAQPVRFIVKFDEGEEQTVMASTPQTANIIRPSRGISTPSQRISSSSKNSKNLTAKIKESTFVGPKNWKSKPIPAPQSTSVEEDLAMSSEEEESDKNSDSKSESSEDESRDQRQLVRLQVEPISNAERGSDKFFCLFCDETWSKFEDAFSHMRKHLGITLQCNECQFIVGSLYELREHVYSQHSKARYQFPSEPKDTIDKDNYIIEFLNEQFRLRKIAERMDQTQVESRIFVVCPLCKKADNILGSSNYHFTSLKAFKIHFWRHAVAVRVACNLCEPGTLVPRTRKKRHFEERHREDWRDMESGQVYQDDLYFVSGLIKNIKTRVKCKFYDRMKFAHGITKEVEIMLVDICKSNVKSEHSKLKTPQEKQN